MRRDVLYLADIVEAAAAIARFVAGVTKESFLADELLQSAVLHKLTVIGGGGPTLAILSTAPCGDRVGRHCWLS